MTIEEIFTKLAAHMVEGIMFHDEVAKAYDFLGLYGFAMCHNYHHMEETEGYLCLSHWYSCHEHKLIKLPELTKTEVIPATWYKYATTDVDTNTKREAVKTLMTKWVEWEKETKKLYQEMRQELCAIGEVAAALKLDCYIKCVDKELIHAEKKHIKFETLNYDISTIIKCQESMKNKFKKKLGW